MKSIIQSFLLFAVLFTALSSCNSQEDSLTVFSPDSIAFSPEFKAFANAENILFNFVAANEVDMEAMNKAAEEYESTVGAGNAPAEVFKGIPNAEELQQLILNRSAAVKALDQKFGYLSLLKADRKKTRDTFRATFPFIMSAAEQEQVIHKKKNN